MRASKTHLRCLFFDDSRRLASSYVAGNSLGFSPIVDAPYFFFDFFDFFAFWGAGAVSSKNMSFIPFGFFKLTHEK